MSCSLNVFLLSLFVFNVFMKSDAEDDELSSEHEGRRNNGVTLPTEISYADEFKEYGGHFELKKDPVTPANIQRNRAEQSWTQNVNARVTFARSLNARHSFPSDYQNGMPGSGGPLQQLYNPNLLPNSFGGVEYKPIPPGFGPPNPRQYNDYGTYGQKPPQSFNPTPGDFTGLMRIPAEKPDKHGFYDPEDPAFFGPENNYGRNPYNPNTGNNEPRAPPNFPGGQLNPPNAEEMNGGQGVNRPLSKAELIQPFPGQDIKYVRHDLKRPMITEDGRVLGKMLSYDDFKKETDDIHKNEVMKPSLRSGPNTNAQDELEVRAGMDKLKTYLDHPPPPPNYPPFGNQYNQQNFGREGPPPYPDPRNPAPYPRSSNVMQNMPPPLFESQYPVPNYGGPPSPYSQNAGPQFPDIQNPPSHYPGSENLPSMNSPFRFAIPDHPVQYQDNPGLRNVGPPNSPGPSYANLYNPNPNNPAPQNPYENPFPNNPNNPVQYNPDPNNPGLYNPAPGNPAQYIPNPNNQGPYYPDPNNPGSYNSYPNNPGPYNPDPNNPGAFISNDPDPYNPEPNKFSPSNSDQNNPEPYNPDTNNPGQYNPIPPTLIPPTPVPPTPVPPTPIPPTPIPPTPIPPTPIPPTPIPPTPIPPTPILLTLIPPTSMPPSSMSPTPIPPSPVSRQVPDHISEPSTQTTEIEVPRESMPNYDLIPGWHELGLSAQENSSAATVTSTVADINSLLTGISNKDVEPVTATPTNDIITEAKQLMRDLKMGYLAGYGYKLMLILERKDTEDVDNLVQGLHSVTEKMIAEGSLDGLGNATLKAIHIVTSTLNNYRILLKRQLPTVRLSLKNRYEDFDPEAVKIFDIMDASYNVDEGDKLLQTLVDVHNYPGNQMSNLDINYKIIDALLQPFRRTVGTERRMRLVNMVNNILIDRFDLHEPLLVDTNPAARQAKKTRRRFKDNSINGRRYNYNLNTKKRTVDDNSYEQNKHKDITNNVFVNYKVSRNKDHEIKNNNGYKKTSQEINSGNIRRNKIIEGCKRKDKSHVCKTKGNQNQKKSNKEFEIKRTRRLKTVQNRHERFNQGGYNYEKSFRNRFPIHENRHSGAKDLLNSNKVKSTGPVSKRNPYVTKITIVKKRFNVVKNNQTLKHAKGNKLQGNLVRYDKDEFTPNQEDELPDHKVKSKYLDRTYKKRLYFNEPTEYTKKIENKTINNSILRNIIEESSYSDDEKELKFVLSDAIRHSDFVFHNFRNNEIVKDEKKFYEQSSYSDEEGLLKNNIYKVFGYDPDLDIK